MRKISDVSRGKELKNFMLSNRAIKIILVGLQQIHYF